MLKNIKKIESKDFWDSNPCGTSATWKMAQDIRFKYTDPFLKDYLQSDIFAKKDVLEIGCGQGLDAPEIVQICRSYVGFDISNVSVNTASREIRRLFGDTVGKFFVGDAEKMPFSDQTFDVVYSYGVLHHTPGFDKAIGEIYRVLKPGGILMTMLYRSFTPLSIILKSVRGLLYLPWIGDHLKSKGLELSRENLKSSNSIFGTFLAELIGCPVIKTYSLSSLRRYFGGRFQVIHSECFRVGFDQIVRVLPKSFRSFWPQSFMKKIDCQLSSWAGFYLLVVAKSNHHNIQGR